MDLLRKCKLPKEESPDASYHLTELKEKGIVVQQDTKYFLSSFGEDLLEKFFELEDVFSEHAAGILIRTSRYSMEPFSEEKIASALIREANMPVEKAAEIARETRIRLQRAKVQYLTTPLIREYINAILVEKHMEEYRHKLTRLGVPGQDIEDALRSGGVLGLQQLHANISRETLEQFVLLRVLPKELADAMLHRIIGVSCLSSFPFLPEEIVVPWVDCQEDAPKTWNDLSLIILSSLSNQNHRFGKRLTISGVPLPCRPQDLNLQKMVGVASAIEHFLKLEDKRIRIIFQADTLPETLMVQNFEQSLGKHIEFFCYQGKPSKIHLPVSNMPIIYGAIENMAPCLESLYCNLLVLLRKRDKVADLAPDIDRLSGMIAGIISVKEESMQAYGYPLPTDGNHCIRIRPIGLPELVRLHRGFEIDQTGDSEGYALEILQEVVTRVSKTLGGKYAVQLAQPWDSPHLLPFAEAALNEWKEAKAVLYLGTTTPICSPGFIRLTEKIPAQKCSALAAHFLSRIPGEFYLNLEAVNQNDLSQIEGAFTSAVLKGRNILLTSQSCIKIGRLEVSVGNFF